MKVKAKTTCCLHCISRWPNPSAPADATPITVEDQRFCGWIPILTLLKCPKYFWIADNLFYPCTCLNLNPLKIYLKIRKIEHTFRRLFSSSLAKLQHCYAAPDPKILMQLRPGSGPTLRHPEMFELNQRQH
jgi:hypothetical protein